MSDNQDPTALHAHLRVNGNWNVESEYPLKLALYRTPPPNGTVEYPGYLAVALISLKSTLNQLGLDTLDMNQHGATCISMYSPDAQIERHVESS